MHSKKLSLVCGQRCEEQTCKLVAFSQGPSLSNLKQTLLQLRQVISTTVRIEELVVEQNDLSIPDSDATSLSISARAQHISLSCQGGCQEATLKVRLLLFDSVLQPHLNSTNLKIRMSFGSAFLAAKSIVQQQFSNSFHVTWTLLIWIKSAP